MFFPLLAISCGHPGVPANAILSGDKFTYGSIIHYSCTAGRRLIGNSTRECQEDSHWSGTLPHCSGTCKLCTFCSSFLLQKYSLLLSQCVNTINVWCVLGAVRKYRNNSFSPRLCKSKISHKAPHSFVEVKSSGKGWLLRTPTAYY